MSTLVLLRHGQSTWNLANRFTGWADEPLTEQGIAEAKQAARKLLEDKIEIHEVHTSFLQRAIKTMWIVLEGIDSMHLPVSKSWRLNEKHYGALQGLNKSETAEKYGEKQVKLWRRAFDVLPPAMEKSDPRAPKNLLHYKNINPEVLPLTESLETCIKRLMPYWEETIVPALQQDKNLLIVAHGNSLRGIVKILKKYSEAEILEINIPTGLPYVFQLDKSLNVLNDRYLADEATLKKLQEAVAKQGKK